MVNKQDVLGQVPPEILVDSGVSWVFWGMIYVLLVTILNGPDIISWLPPGKWIEPLVIAPLWGISFIFRDVIQYLYEDTNTKKTNAYGFWISMIFVGLAAIVSLNFGDASIKESSVIAFVIAAFVDGIIFSWVRGKSFAHRLLLSNIVCTALVDVPLIEFLQIQDGVIDFNLARSFFGAFMEVSPALLLFSFSFICYFLTKKYPLKTYPRCISSLANAFKIS